MAKQRLPVIRASEIGEYIYCTRAWWLHRVAELEPEGHERRERGTMLHQRHGRAVAGSRVLLLVALILIMVALTLLVIGR